MPAVRDAAGQRRPGVRIGHSVGLSAVALRARGRRPASTTQAKHLPRRGPAAEELADGRSREIPRSRRGFDAHPVSDAHRVALGPDI